jgi:hypothetical protein
VAMIPGQFSGAYFKAGAYTQANCSNSVAPCRTTTARPSSTPCGSLMTDPRWPRFGAATAAATLGSGCAGSRPSGLS